MFADFDKEANLTSVSDRRIRGTTRVLEECQGIETAESRDAQFGGPLSSEGSWLEESVNGDRGNVFGDQTSQSDSSAEFSDIADDHSSMDDAVRRLNQEPSLTSEAKTRLDELVEHEVQTRLAAAEEERERMLAGARQEAYAKGMEDARAEFEDAKAQYASRFETLVEDTRSQVAETCRDNEHKAVELAFQIAKKLLGEALADHREYIQEVISEAIRAAGNTDIKSVRVSPRDYEFLSTSQSRDVSQTTERAWKLESDDSIGAGCIVVTSSGEVDFDLEKSWARMREKVTRGPKT
jgi:flagellar biosynthesis/type III secretory pathway protein FliH